MDMSQMPVDYMAENKVRKVKVEGNVNMDQRAVLSRIGIRDGQTFSPTILSDKVQEAVSALYKSGLFDDVYNDLILMVAVRNVCAHEERLYNARFGDNDAFGYPEFLQVVRYYLTPAAYLRLVEDIRAAARRCLTGNANLRAAVERVTP